MTRRVLLDENFPRNVAPGLAAAGHDVLMVATVSPGISDRAVLALARQTQRWLLTFDADFGDLVFHRGEAPPPEILYFRLHPIVATEVLALALQALADGDPRTGCFRVVSRDAIRTRQFESTPGDGGS